MKETFPSLVAQETHVAEALLLLGNKKMCQSLVKLENTVAEIHFGGKNFPVETRKKHIAEANFLSNQVKNVAKSNNTLSNPSLRWG